MRALLFSVYSFFEFYLPKKVGPQKWNVLRTLWQKAIFQSETEDVGSGALMKGNGGSSAPASSS